MKKKTSSGVKKKTPIKRGKKVEQPKEEPRGKYLLTISLGGNTYISYTDNIEKAILSLKPEKITNKVVVRVEEGKKITERILFVYPARRIFNVPLAAQFFAKNIVQRLK
jgi:hypothetical protein